MLQSQDQRQFLLNLIKGHHQRNNDNNANPSQSYTFASFTSQRTDQSLQKSIACPTAQGHWKPRSRGRIVREHKNDRARSRGRIVREHKNDRAQSNPNTKENPKWTVAHLSETSSWVKEYH
jgi:hypothetical protein